MLPKVKTCFLSQVVVFWLAAAMVVKPLLELWDLQARGVGRESFRESSAELAWGGRTCCHFPKAGPASRRGEGQSGWSLWPAHPTPPFCLGVCPGASETEFTVNVVTSGNSQRGRGKGLEEGARTPGPQFPS